MPVVAVVVVVDLITVVVAATAAGGVVAVVVAAVVVVDLNVGVSPERKFMESENNIIWQPIACMLNEARLHIS